MTIGKLFHKLKNKLTILYKIVFSRHQENSENFEIDLAQDQLFVNLLNLQSSTAYDIMLPRADIISAPTTIMSDEALQLFIKTKVSSIVIYSHDLDYILGTLHLKDFVAWQNSKNTWNIKNIMRKTLFISPAMRTLDLLLNMQKTKSQIAIVVDEYGGTDGLVTFADLIQEIIGDIENARTQTSSSFIEQVDENTIIVDARLSIENFNKSINPKFNLVNVEEDIDTLGGLVVSLAGKVPKKDENINYSNEVMFEILEADPRKVQRIKIKYLSD